MNRVMLLCIFTLLIATNIIEVESRRRQYYYTYGLRQAGGHYYVGRTSNPNQRITDHFEGRGSQWTQRYQPVKVDYIRRHSSERAARTAETAEYYDARAAYGNDRVRGAGNTNSRRRK